MPKASNHHSLSPNEKREICLVLERFFSASNQEGLTAAKQKLKQLARDFYAAHEQNKQALGYWSAFFLQEFINCLKDNAPSSVSEEPALVTFLANLPCPDNSNFYHSLLAKTQYEDTAPLAPERYLFLLHLVSLLIELRSPLAASYLIELEYVIPPEKEPSVSTVFVHLLFAQFRAQSGQLLQEALTWLEALAEAWQLRNEKLLIYILTQWLISLNWLRPQTLRKELLLALYEINKQEADHSTALILYELFNLPDKTDITSERQKYLDLLFKLPAFLFSVKQLQDMYYYSGNLKSIIHSSFPASVSDFKHSNYYIYKYWNRIGYISHFLQKTLSPPEFLEVLPNLNAKTQELISLMNSQSNAFVEALQANYSKIDELYHKVEELSLKDTLTGLYNRRYLYNHINEALMLSVRKQLPLSFVIIDIDNFKQINDTYGHLAGDFILSSLSNFLKDYFRKSDFLVRYGGEEFLIVMFDSDHQETELTLESLRKQILSRDFIYRELNLHITVSIGIASVIFKNPCVTIDLEKLISEADAAMYESKARGKNQITSRVYYY